MPCSNGWRNFRLTLAPEPRRAPWRAIKKLPAGDVKLLDGKLTGWSRLRVFCFHIFPESSVSSPTSRSNARQQGRAKIFQRLLDVAAGILPAVEGLASRRPEKSSRTLGTPSNFRPLVPCARFYPPGGTPRLYGWQDARRYAKIPFPGPLALAGLGGLSLPAFRRKK